MKTILMVGNYFQYRRTNPNVWHALAARLRKNDWTVITTSNKRNRFLRLMDMLFTIYIAKNTYQLAEVDVFSGPAFIWAEFSVLFLKLLNKKIVLTLHGGNLPEFAKKHPNRMRRVLFSAEKVISPSSYLQKSLKNFRNDIFVIPNPIDLESYSYHCRKSAGPNLIWVRAFHEIYNPSLAPKVIHRLLNDWPEVQLTMMGPDKGDGSLEKVKAVAKDLGVLDRINLPGGVPREKVPEFLSRGDIFINTTNFDNTPVSVIEAMACGMCVVSTNVGGLPYLLDDGEDALLVPPDDPEAMAEAVERILKDPDLASKLSQNARQKAVRFDWSIVLPMWDKLFSDLIEKTHEQV